MWPKRPKSLYFGLGTKEIALLCFKAGMSNSNYLAGRKSNKNCQRGVRNSKKSRVGHIKKISHF